VSMATVTISSKFQAVIPREICEAMRLKPGQKVQVFRFRNRVEIVPLRSIRSMRGFLKGIDYKPDRPSERA
jgi:AbrB family looped-hinge helix DNA binding protein